MDIKENLTGFKSCKNCKYGALGIYRDKWYCSKPGRIFDILEEELNGESPDYEKCFVKKEEK